MAFGRRQVRCVVTGYGVVAELVVLPGLAVAGRDHPLAGVVGIGNGIPGLGDRDAVAVA